MMSCVCSEVFESSHSISSECCCSLTSFRDGKFFPSPVSSLCGLYNVQGAQFSRAQVGECAAGGCSCFEIMRNRAVDFFLVATKFVLVLAAVSISFSH